MLIRCRAGRDDIPLAFLFVPFPFSGGIGKRSSAGYDRKVPEYTEFLRKIQPSLWSFAFISLWFRARICTLHALCFGLNKYIITCVEVDFFAGFGIYAKN